MDRTRLHDVRNELAVAVGSVYAMLDGKLAPDANALTTVLAALEKVDAALTAERAPAREPDAASGNERLLRAIVEGSPYAKILVNDAGRIVLVNAQTEALFGYPRAELYGRSIEELVPERFRRGHADLRASFARAPIARPMGAGRELFGRRSDASEFPIEIGLTPIETDAGRFTLVAIGDITERHMAAASRFKSAFVATMSHELRTPLTAIVGAAELLARAPIDAGAREHVATIAQSADALLGLIGSVLDFSKIEAGKMELYDAPFAPATILAAAVDTVAHAAHAKGITIETAVDAAIPTVLGDALRVRQVLLNLLNNAVKFSDRGRIAVRLTQSPQPAEALELRFEVADTGIGIAAETLPRLFAPFVQADPSAARYDGTGLGLSICKSLVALMGGAIGVESALGEGSRFWFTVPTRAAEGASAGEDAHATPFVAPADAVLVVEDDRRLQRLLALQFAELGVRAVFAGDGAKALDAVARERFAMIFMDCRMPIMDGFAATRAIRQRENGARIPIAAMTASASSEDRDACVAAGMDDYLTKPVRLAELRAMVARWSVR